MLREMIVAEPIVYPPADTPRDARARWELGVYTALVIGLSGAVIICSNIWADPPAPKVFAQCVRFLLTCALMWWLWRGSPHAKWVCVVLFGAAGIMSLISGLVVLVVRAGGNAAPAPGFVALLAFMQATYLPFALRLAIPTSAVSRYLERKHELGPAR